MRDSSIADILLRIPTTSIFSRTDEVVQPENGNDIENSSSAIEGSRGGNILVQDFCPLLAEGHGQQLYFNFTYQVILIALRSQSRFASPRQVMNANIPCTPDAVGGLTCSS